jgi:hypothetical protein
VAFELLPVALATEVFVCVTGPSSPELSIRITTFTFLGATWVELASAAPFWVTGALWLEVCAWPGAGSGAGAPEFCPCVLL